MTENQNESLTVYELGFNLISSLAEEQIPAQFTDLKGLLEKNGATFISEEFPKLRPLAYTMVKNIQGKNNKHDKAYFGWVKFELDSSKVAELKEILDRNDNILRYIFIKTVKENTMYGPKLGLNKSDATKREEKEEAVIAEIPAEILAEVPAEVVDEELDKSIDDLVVS